jgi:hypothetical protein
MERLGGHMENRELRMGMNEMTGLAYPVPSWVLPFELEEVLKIMGAFYQRQPSVVRQGLDADDVRNRAYLGTYFPRSVFEWGVLWSELLALPLAQTLFQAKKTISIASFGSGTGGDVVGALYALVDAGLKPDCVQVYSFDGNSDALGKQRQLLSELVARKVFPFAVDFRCCEFVWGQGPDTFRGSCAQIRPMLPESVDLVQASKWLIEFYNRDLKTAQGTIGEFLRFAENVVAPTGFVGMLDLTTSDCGRWFPEIHNGESVDYLKGGGGLRTVAPVPCALRQGDCPGAHGCYTRRAFAVASSFCMNDSSQVLRFPRKTGPFSKRVLWSTTDTRRTTNEGQTVHGRADHRSAEGGRSGPAAA